MKILHTILLLVAGSLHAAPLVGLPQPPELTAAGRSLIYEFETGGERQYDRSPFPEFPGGPSGITWGIGYDAHQNARAVILSDWRALGGRESTRLANTQPYVGASARAHLSDVRDIRVSWGLASEVFDKVDIARTGALCRRTFPGFDDLRPNAQAAIMSLVFNRGASLTGPNRVEMRAIRDLIPRRDYEGIATQLRKMKHLWYGTEIYAGMARRREAEARLVLTP